MTMNDLKDRLASLDAVIAARTEGPEAALEQLRGLVDPDSFRRRIVLLAQLERFSEARDLLATRTPDAAWIEQGIKIAILAEDCDLAKRLVDAASVLDDTSGTLSLRTTSAFLEATIERHGRTYQRSGGDLFRYAVSPQDRAALETGIALLDRFRNSVISRGSITSPLERDAMTALALALGLLDRSEEAEPIVSILTRFRPVDLELARFTVDGRLPDVPNLDEAVLESHPGGLESNLLARLLRTAGRKPSPSTFESLVVLKSSAKTPDERALLFSALSQIAHRIGPAAISAVDDLRDQLLDLEAPDHIRIAADHAVRAGRAEEALDLLSKGDATTTTSYGKWVLAQCLFALGKNEEGLQHFVRAALDSLNDSWLQEAAHRASAANLYDQCIRCLESLRDYYPWILGARAVLARMLWNTGRSPESISELETLAHLTAKTSENRSVRIDLARAYLQTNHPQNAIDILAPLEMKGDNEPTVAVIRAVALRHLGKPNDAFQSLHSYKDEYWTNKDFLFAYFEIANAAGKEQEASQALSALNELRERGLIDQTELRLGSLDEILAIARGERERRQHANAAILRSQLPWTLVAQTSRSPFIWDWMVHTQELSWLREDTTNRAEYSLYVTNGFAVERTEGDPYVTEIEAGSSETICVDYSALITLHELQILPNLFRTYRSVLIPAEYQLSVLEDVRRLQPHQLSQRAVVDKLTHLLDIRRVYVASKDEEATLTRIDEYNDATDDKRPCGLRDLLNAMEKSGRLDVNAAQRLRSLVLRRESDDLGPIVAGQPILVDLLTLKSIHREGVLDIVANAFRVYLSEADRRTVSEETRAYRFQDVALSKIQALWKEIDQQPNVEYVSGRNIQSDDQDKEALGLRSYRLAASRNVPLLADDRALQTVVTNQRRTAKDAAFGTAEFLGLLHSRGEIDLAIYTQALLQLIRWRYKFLLPPAEVLHRAVTQYEHGTPGIDLTVLARYAHDCMNDPGLLGGLEEATPPTSMALKLYISWHTRIGEFLALLWTDSSVALDRRQSITAWVAQVMLPPVPVSIDERVHDRLAGQVREIAITSAVLKSILSPSSSEMPMLLNRFAQDIGVSRRRLIQLYGEIAGRAIA